MDHIFFYFQFHLLGFHLENYATHDWKGRQIIQETADVYKTVEPPIAEWVSSDISCNKTQGRWEELDSIEPLENQRKNNKPVNKAE